MVLRPEDSDSMESLYDVVHEVEVFMDGHLTEDGKSLRTALVESARRLDGAGCDGLLMAKAERFTEGLLGEVEEDQLREIWVETENGILSTEQGFDDPERWEMIHDIGLGVVQHIVDGVCQEAKKSQKSRTRRKRSR